MLMLGKVLMQWLVQRLVPLWEVRYRCRCRRRYRHHTDASARFGSRMSRTASNRDERKSIRRRGLMVVIRSHQLLE